MLAAPITEKEVVTGGYGGRFGKFRYAHVSMQGWRKNMEDSYLASCERNPSVDSESLMIFGVFDGHGGEEVAKVVAEIGKEKILGVAELGSKISSLEKGSAVDTNVLNEQKKLLTSGLDKAFRGIDSQVKSNLPTTEAGCTGNVVVMTENLICCANIGDSRSVLSRSGIAVELSRDHKPTDEKETERIKQAGGSVIRGRVCGGVAVSRSFGDFTFKQSFDLDESQQQISCVPDCIIEQRDKDIDEFIIICCDGIWDMVDNRACVRFVRTRLQAGITDLGEIGKALLDHCLQAGSKDNMTCIIVLFEGGEKLCEVEKKTCGIS
mmetsp:Transcript_12867/g.26262  ORF Transcript_12867/g.26262 Transcript_12867/m.26262 type:complete len:322 (+) Transcript_12867:166-1131(+)